MFGREPDQHRGEAPAALWPAFCLFQGWTSCMTSEEAETDLPQPDAKRIITESEFDCEEVCRNVEQDASTIGDCSRQGSVSLDFESQGELGPDTLFIFDWDDTLFPTTQVGEIWKGANPEAPAWKAHAEEVEALIRAASNIGRVGIVTMASKEWVDRTKSGLMPAVSAAIDELGVVIVSAVDGVTKGRGDRQGSKSAKQLKRKAMERLIGHFDAQGFRHIVSIGDSFAERDALRDILRGDSPSDLEIESDLCRCKTVKLQFEPTIDELVEQTRMLTSLLPTIALYEGDLDLGDLDGASPRV